MLDPNKRMPGLNLHAGAVAAMRGGIRLPEHFKRWLVEYRRRHPRGAPSLKDAFSPGQLGYFDRRKAVLTDVMELAAESAPETWRRAARRTALEKSKRTRDREFAKRACAAARRQVDQYLKEERDANDRLIHGKPSINSVAVKAWRGRSRDQANKVYREVMTPENLRRWKLTNPLDELSADTKRTKRS